MQANYIEYHITSGYIQIVAEGNVLPAFWAHPDMGGTFPGIVLLHDQWGLTAHVRKLVRRLAQAGYYVIAPDMFNQQQPTTAAQAAQAVEGLGAAGPPYAAATLNALRTHIRCNGDIAAVGFDFGGEIALHLALHDTFLKAAVNFYGDYAPHISLLPTAETPLLFIYGTGERGVAEAYINTLQQQLEAAPVAHFVQTYPDQNSGFFNDSMSEYDSTAAEAARYRLLDFLDDYLRAPTQPPGIRDKRY